MPSRECDAALDRLFEFIDDELPDEELHRIGRHLKTCPPCEAEHRIKEKIKNLTALSGGDEAPDELRGRILASIRSARQGV